MALADDREAVAGQALDQPQLPERLAAVELLSEALRERATSPREIVRGVRAAVRAPQRVLRGVADTGKILEAAAETPEVDTQLKIGL
ncbi:MAG TPA: hypothetical protein VHH14_09335 [Solirubrobacterales bacterium]|nr:hypothetical protein [Solirubrobacterales bacterium]